MAVIWGTRRLLIEAGVFGFAAWGLFDVGRIWLALVFAGVVLLHYALSYDRVAWLLKSPR
jgi:hypothetical protein